MGPKTARRLFSEFDFSVGFINGKRCLGGMLELMMHCDYLVSVEGASLGMPEVTLPVVPGMEGCHWLFRKTKPEDWQKLLKLLLDGKPVKAADGVGWLVNHASSLEKAIQHTWKTAVEGSKASIRKLEEGALKDFPKDACGLQDSGDPNVESGRKAIFECIKASCGAKLAEALDIQSKHSANFMSSKECQKGRIGSEFKKTMNV